MDTKNKATFWGYLPGTIFILLLTIGLILYNKERSQLKENYTITYGVITECKDVGRRSSGGIFYFNFKVGDTLISDQIREGISSQYSSIFIGKTFPVVYLPNDLRNNDMLITPKSFELLDIPFPDSLNWVRQYQ